MKIKTPKTRCNATIMNIPVSISMKNDEKATSTMGKIKFAE
jgi:hypothetical protein